MYNIYDFYALEAVFFISGKCTDEQINKIDCRARAYYAEKSWNEFVPERIEICYPAVCPCRTAQKYCGADAEHKARVGESVGIYRASDFFEKFHIRTPFGSFYINCIVTYRYILVKRHLDIKNCPTAQLLHYAAGHYNFVICRRARRFQHQRLWSNPRQGRRREFFSRRGSQGCSADICEAVLRRKRDRNRGR